MCLVQGFKYFILKSHVVFQNVVPFYFFYYAVPRGWEICNELIAECCYIDYIDENYMPFHRCADCRVSGGLNVIFISTAKLLKSIDICKNIMLKVY